MNHQTHRLIWSHAQDYWMAVGAQMLGAGVILMTAELTYAMQQHAQVAGNSTARTGDKSTSLTPIFDKDKTQKEVAAQVAITSEFGKNASKAVGDYAATKLKEAQANNDQAGIDAWKEGGTNRVALHAVVGGLTGGAAGAVGAGAASAVAPNIDQLQGQLKTALKDAGLGDNAANVISSLAGGTTAAAMGAAASGGNVAGAATAFNADMNNRQLHPSEVQKAKELATKSGGKYTQAQIEEQMRLMGNAATGEQPNTTTALTNTEAIVNSILSDPGMPKAVQGSAVSEVPGQANTELQNWIVNNTKEGAGYIPGQSPYINSNAALNAPKLTTDVKVNAPTAAVANNDVAGKSGVGVQQNAPISADAVADTASGVSRQAGVIGAAATAATAAAPAQVKPITGAVAVGATVIGVAADAVEQMARPDTGQSVVNSAGAVVGEIVNKRIPAAAPISNEIIETLKNSNASKSIQEKLNAFPNANK